MRGDAALPSTGSQAGSPREPPEAPPDVLGVTWLKLARAHGQAGSGTGGGQEGAGAVGYHAFPQHLEAFQRPQETLSSPSEFLPCPSGMR